MKVIKKMMLMCVIIIFLVILIMSVLLIKKESIESEIIENRESMGIGEFSKDIIEQINYSEWFQVESCINQYLSLINMNNSVYFRKNEDNDFVKSIEDNEIKEGIYNLLSESYINDNKITISNIYDHIKTVNEEQIYIILEIKKIIGNNSNQYITQGFIQEGNTFNEEKFFIVNFDLDQYIFSIEPIEGVNNIENIEVNDTKIYKNDSNTNTIPSVSVTIENIIRQYLTNIKNIMLYYPEKAYVYLDDEYKEKRFESVNKFIKYLNENRGWITGVRLTQYKVDQENDYTRYICVDQYGNYYIFKETAVMQYTVILDTYTIDLPEFIEKYNSTNNQGKIALNIQKFIQAINAKDYSYAYSKLDDTFKNSYFKTEKDFTNYIKQHTFETNNIEYKEYSVQGKNNIYKLVLTDKTGNDTGSKNLNIVMQLKEGTDFVMSFEVEE